MQDKIVQLHSFEYEYESEWGRATAIELLALSHSGRVYSWNADRWVLHSDSPELEVTTDE